MTYTGQRKEQSFPQLNKLVKAIKPVGSEITLLLFTPLRLR